MSTKDPTATPRQELVDVQVGSSLQTRSVLSVRITTLNFQSNLEETLDVLLSSSQARFLAGELLRCAHLSES